MRSAPFRDRAHAGSLLARAVIARMHAGANPVVLALPRGGVPVASPVATLLRAPLDLFLVRKLGLPGEEEVAIGAIASGGIRVLNDRVIAECGIDAATIDLITRREQQEIERRDLAYRGDRPPIELLHRTIVLVDDGLATGATMRAAVTALRSRKPAAIIVAVPVGSREACQDLRHAADDLICLETPEPFIAVGKWYEDFSQTSDDEVRRVLHAYHQK